MKPPFPLGGRRAALVLAAAIVAGCDSQSHLSATPGGGSASPVPAILRQSGGAQEVLISDPSTLAPEIRAASNLKVAIAGRLLDVTRAPNGSLDFAIPAGLTPTESQAGVLSVLFVLDDRQSRLVPLDTGSPIAFASDPVQVSPDVTRVPLGQDVQLTAATDASADAYDFAWSFSASADGPWQPIDGSGKQIDWSPSSVGDYYLRIEALDRKRQITHVVVTPTQRLQVIAPDALFTLAPSDGALTRGQAVDLSFALPDGQDASQPHTWYAGTSAQGPWELLTGSGATNHWLPTLPGSYYLRVDTADGQNARTESFVTTKALVRVNENAPIITASRSAANRGDRVDLTLNLPDAGAGPFAWYDAQQGGAWQPIPGSQATVKFLPDQPGAYNFRVDLPLADGTVRTFTTTQPLVSVAETTPLFSTVPAIANIKPGENVLLTANGKGFGDSAFHFVWSESLNPQMYGWTPIPDNEASDLRQPSLTWKVPTTQPLGNYYVRLDAIEDATGHVYHFDSTAPLVFLIPTS